MKKVVVMSVMVIALFLSQTANADLVNGDFQITDPEWLGWEHDCYLTVWYGENKTASFGYLPGTLSQTIQTVSGTSYEFVFSLMHDSTGGTQDIYPYYDENQEFHAFWNGDLIFTAGKNNFDWTNFEFTVEATGDSSVISFWGQETGAAGYTPFGGYYHLDNVSLSSSAGTNPVPEPATMLLLGSGLIGLAGFRRKFKK